MRTELLVPSETKIVCPYKGVASYYSVKAGDETSEGLVWYYPEPQKIEGYLCFNDEKIDFEVEG